MAKIVIQVPVDEALLKELDNLSKKQRRARSELVRHACLRYLHEVESAEMDKVYQQGYKRIPEESDIGEAQAEMAEGIAPKESW